ncbi:MAG TPA: PfkB family carbohydrate kinase [Nitrosopumilaceae archaeon]|nr:PfkB family carbohydrate kinase [Nitrosopumilaceae archaeon]
MKIDIFSHCTIDEIVREGSVIETAGGPACYCGLTARNLKFDVEFHTKIGPDFTHREFLEKNKIIIPEISFSQNPTTRFLLEISGIDRNLYLKTKCDPIEFDGLHTDGCIVSPVFDEISYDTLEKIKKDSKFTLLDPQGFLRRKDQNNKIYLEKTDMNLSNISAIKVDVDEAYALTGQSDKDAMRALQKKGIEHVLLTNKREITVLVKDRLYYLTIPNTEVFDTTGIGDIFCASFACTYLKEKDFFWAMCFAVGAAQAALETKKTGLEKIPQRGAIETNASYLYNLVKFSQI